MAFRLMEERGTPSYGVVSYIVDNESDIANLSTDHQPGSTALVASTSSVYVLNNQLEWILLETEGGGGSELPIVTISDNGKVLKVIEGEWAAGQDEALPAVTSLDDGKILKVNDGSWEVSNETIELPTVSISDEGKVLKVNASGEWAKGDEVVELPQVTSSDEGKVLTVNASGQWDKENPPVELPTVTSSDNGKVLKVNNGTWGIGTDEKLPAVTSADNGKILKVADGAWVAGDETVELPIVTSTNNDAILMVVNGSWTWRQVNPTEMEIVSGSSTGPKFLNVNNENKAVFYGLALAAGDSTQAAANISLYPMGTYTDTAKAKIQNMLGFVTLTQTEYDSLTTKNPSTIYIITED